YTTHQPLALTISWEALKPDLQQYQNLALIVGIAQTLAGLEISAVHTPYVHRPQQAYPLATLTSTLLVLTSSILGSLAIAALVPTQTIDLNNGVAQTFASFLNYFHIPYLESILIVLMAIGGITAASAWISGPSASLAQAAEDDCLPRLFKKTNSAGVSFPILILQGLLVSAFCGLFIVMPTVSSAYWLLTVIAGQLYLMMYLLMFATAIKLRAKKSASYVYKMGGVKTTWFVSILGSVGCLSFILLGFLPPPSLGLANYSDYYLIQTISLAVMVLLPPLIYYFSQPKSLKLKAQPSLNLEPATEQITTM
ncbi:MAG TPA: amino acid permease, partial [Gammaproteobacteria bacterium]|nr:amino acid permease [Gammaproteobacteria bacterium]